MDLATSFAGITAENLMSFRVLFILMALLPLTLSAAQAERTPVAEPAKTLSDMDRLSLARQFVARLSGKYKEIELKEDAAGVNTDDVSYMEDGEELLFNIRITKKLLLESPLLGVVSNGGVLLSLQDFISGLDLPIVYDAEKGHAQGWYIRQNKKFDLDSSARKVTTDQGSFTFSKAVQVQDNDVLVPYKELAQWFGLSLSLNISRLDMLVTSPIPLPIEEKLARGGRRFKDYKIGPAELPRMEEKAAALGIPFVDVSTTSSYVRPGEGGEAELRSRASVRTSGDFAGGTLTSQSTYDKEDLLTNARVNYKQESLEKDLLGPLKARRFELGDVNPVIVPLNDNPVIGLGARVTNADPDRSSLRPDTRITGTTFPGWEVELYRENQLLGYQVVDDSGLYAFENVDLFTEDNRFRVVLYGPQGEVEEQEIFVPVDPSRLAEMGSAYDISVTAQDTQTYRKIDSDNDDRGAPNVTALYEVPVGPATALSAGVSTRQDDGEQKATAHGGVSTKMLGTLFNLNTAVDNAGEMAGEVIARRKFGDHEFRNETRVGTDRYGVLESRGSSFSTDIDGDGFEDEENADNEVFNNDFSINGPFALPIGEKPRYDLGLNYIERADGDVSLDTVAGLNTMIRPFAVGQQFRYRMADGLEDDEIYSLTNLTGRIGQNRLRLSSNYEIAPENQLESITANLYRRLSKKTDMTLGLRRQMETKLTEGFARLDWDAGVVNIAPGVSYNSDNDLTATLNTRFGLARDPSTGKIQSFDRLISSYGGASVFVYLDKNGNNVFDDGDEPVEGAIVKAPQSGKRATTDEDGRVFFNDLGKMRLTDVYVDPESLPDPFWVTGYEGASILPREGHVAPLEFPIHVAGEMDGTVYLRGPDGTSTPLRNVHMSLYDQSGKKILSANSESDGFYLFSKIPPGTYYLNVDDSAVKDAARPLPQMVRIGYEGTTIYSNNIYLDGGRPDVALSILANREAAYGARGEEFKDRNLVFNLGTYKSRLSMALAWFKIRTLHPGLFAEADLLEKPSQSVPGDRAGNYQLRLSYRENDLASAYKICGIVVRGGGECSVEMMPEALAQKYAARD